MYFEYKLLFLILLFCGCSNVEDVGTKEIKTWRDNENLPSLELVVDSILSEGIDSLDILIPDSNVLVELYRVPQIYILDSNLNALDFEICNGHFPDFKEEVLDYLDSAEISYSLNAVVKRYLPGLKYLNGSSIIKEPSKKFYILHAYSPNMHKVNGIDYLESILPFLDDEISYKPIVAVNYKERKFSDFSFQKRRIQFMIENESFKFPKEVLKEYKLD